MQVWKGEKMAVTPKKVPMFSLINIPMLFYLFVLYNVLSFTLNPPMASPLFQVGMNLGGVVAFTDWMEGPTPMTADEARRYLTFMKFPSMMVPMSGNPLGAIRPVIIVTRRGNSNFVVLETDFCFGAFMIICFSLSVVKAFIIGG